MDVFTKYKNVCHKRTSVAEDTVPVLVVPIVIHQVVSQAIQMKPEDMTTMVRENAAVRKSANIER